MKKLITAVAVIMICCVGYSQSVGIGTATPNGSALLDLQSSDKGFLLPRMSTSQKNSLASPATGLMVFDTDKGTIYMYDGAQWLALIAGNNAPIQIPRTSNTPSNNTGFGYKVCLSGNSAVISSRNVNANSVDTAWVFVKTNGNWVFQAKLVQSDPVAGDKFGEAVAISGDYILVGAPNRNSGAGAVYAFSRSGSVWTQTAILTSTPQQSSSYFGNTISMEGVYALVGAPSFYTNQAVQRGCVYNFYRNINGWQQQQQLFGISALEDFGSAIAISGAYALVGAPRAAYTGIANSGVAYLLKRTSMTWAVTDTIYPGSPAENAFFGYAVTLSDNLDWAFIGVPGTFIGPNINSAVYGYMIAGSQLLYLIQLSCPTPNTSSEGQCFGISLSMYNGYLIVGAPLIHTEDAADGRIYIYKYEDNVNPYLQWNAWKTIKEMDIMSSSSLSDRYGYSVFINGFNIILGNAGDNNAKGKVIFMNLE